MVKWIRVEWLSRPPLFVQRIDWVCLEEVVHIKFATKLRSDWAGFELVYTSVCVCVCVCAVVNTSQQMLHINNNVPS